MIAGPLGPLLSAGLLLMVSGIGWGYASLAGLAGGLAYATFTAVVFSRHRGRRLTTRQVRNFARSRRSFQTLGGVLSSFVVLLIAAFWPMQFFLFAAAFFAGWAWLGMPLLALHAHRREGVFAVYT